MNNKTLKKEFVDGTLLKIKTVLDLTLDYYGVSMAYDIGARNKLFCEIIGQTKKDLTTTEFFKKIQETVTVDDNLDEVQTEWLSQQIYEYHKDIFVLHYFYAILYSYNYDGLIREKITEVHVEKFFHQANEIYKKYKKLMKEKSEKFDFYGGISYVYHVLLHF